MRKIEISLKTYKRLKEKSKTKDTFDSIINSLLDKLESQAELVVKLGHENSDIYKISDFAFTRDNIPDVTHTKVLNASFDGNELEHPRWKDIVAVLYGIAKEEGYSDDKIRKITNLKVIPHQYSDRGYNYIPHLDTSFPPSSANASRDIIVSFPNIIDVKIKIKFIWRDKKNALHPRKTAVIII